MVGSPQGIEFAAASRPVARRSGGNAGASEPAEAIRALSAQPMFVPFVGIGKDEFPFPRKRAELPGRAIDNAGFMPVDDLDAIEDLELYDRLSNGFPPWLAKARERGVR